MIEIKSRIQVEVNEALENGTLQIGLSVMRQPRGEKNEHTKRVLFLLCVISVDKTSLLGLFGIRYMHQYSQYLTGFPQDVLIGK